MLRCFLFAQSPLIHRACYSSISTLWIRLAFAREKKETKCHSHRLAVVHMLTAALVLLLARAERLW